MKNIQFSLFSLIAFLTISPLFLNASSFDVDSLNSVDTNIIPIKSENSNQQSTLGVAESANSVACTPPYIVLTFSASRCGSGSVTLGAEASISAAMIYWYSSSTSNTSLGSGTSFTTPSLSATTTYYVAAFYNSCMSARVPITATINSIPTISGTTTVCKGSTTVLTGSGTAATTNPWVSSVPSVATVTNSGVVTGVSAGTSSITYKNSSGCSTTTTVTVYSIPTITGVISSSRCGTGSVTLGAATGGGTINWYGASSGGSSLATGTSFTTPSLTASKTYYVDATYYGGCISPRSAVTATINALPSMPTITATGATTFCSGGSVTLTSSSGASYLWSNGATSQSITVTSSGSYTVKVTNANGCQSASSAAKVVTVNALPPPPTITATGATTFCAGGSVTLTSSAGSGYLWSTGATTQSINVNTSGNYTVKVTNVNGCQSDASLATTVTVIPVTSTPTITASGATTFCEGGSVTLTSSSGYYYSWSNGAKTQSITVSSPGSYSVQITNPNCCQSASSVAKTITVNAIPAMPTITASDTTTFCLGGNVTLTSSSGASYQWSTGATTQSINVSTSGNYTVRVTNANGCQSVSSTAKTVTVNDQPSTPTITASGATTFCAGGSVTLTSSAGSGYLWSTGATTQSISVSTSGSYSVRVKNASGCLSAPSSSKVVTVISLPSSPVITPSGSISFCEDGVTLTSSSGYSYLWSNGARTQSILAPTGRYSVQVANADGCWSASSSATLVTMNPSPSKPTITVYGATTFCSGGSVTLTSSSGSSYEWSNGASTQSITVTSSGSYSVKVSNSYGCMSASSDAITVTVNPLPATPTITDSGVTYFCSGGSATLTSSSCEGYLWSNGMESQIIDVQSSGNYSVRVRNSYGCWSPSSLPTTITVNPSPSAPTITASGSTTFCEGGSVTLTSSPGSDYLWSNGATTRSITVSSSGNYSVQVRNLYNCWSPFSLPATITVNPVPSAPTITTSGSTTFCEGGSVTLTSSAGSGYLWSNSATTQSIIVGSSGSYFVKVNNANGCQSASSIATTVTVNPLPATPTITTSGSTTFCEGGSVTLTSSAGSGYLWSNGATTQSIIVTSAGSFSVKVTNVNGCQSASSVATTVTVNSLPAMPTITTSGSTTFCEGGSVILTSSPGSDYLWSNGATTRSITVSSSGNYSVQVRNSNGCWSPSSLPTTITVNPSPSAPTISASGSTTFCDGGSVTLTSSLGSGYLWSNGAITRSITVSSSGSYSVRVFNANGCQSASSVATTVTVNPLPAMPTITTSGSTTFCEGGRVTLTSSAGSGYLWSNDETTQSLDVAFDGSYFVTVTDSNGCRSNSSAAIQIIVNPLPIVPSGIEIASLCGPGLVYLPSTTDSLMLKWYDTLTGGIELQSPVTINEITTLFVEVENQNGCSSSARKAVTINIPALPIINLAFADPVGVCGAGNVIFMANATYGTVKWFDSLVGGTEIVPPTTISETITLYAEAVSDGGCSSNKRQAVTAKVYDRPSVPSVWVTPAAICGSGNVVFTATADSAYIKWYDSSIGGNQVTPPTYVSENTMLYAEAISSNGCKSSSRMSAEVVVKPSLAIPNIPTVSNNCGSSDLFFTGEPEAGVTWYWQSLPEGEDMTFGNSSFTVDSADTYYLRAYSASNECWSASVPKVAAPKTVPAIPVNPTFVNYCGYSELSYSGTPEDHTGWVWQTSETGTDLTKRDNPYLVETPGAYFLRAFNGFDQCWSDPSSPVVLLPKVAPSITGTLNVCAGSTTQLSGNATPSGTSPWTSADSSIAAVDDNGLVTGISAGTTVITYNTNEGCTTAATIVVKAIPATPSAPVVENNCGSSELSYSMTPESYSGFFWQTLPTGTDLSKYANPFIVTEQATYYIRGYNSVSQCWGNASDPVIASPKTIPSITSVTFDTICGPDSVTLSATSSAGVISWYRDENKGGGLSLGTGDSITTFIKESAIFYVDATDNNCTTSTRTAVPATVNAIPTLIITPPPAVCSPPFNCDITSPSITAGSSDALELTYWIDEDATETLSNPYSVLPGLYYIKGTNLETGCSVVKPINW